MKSTSRNMLEVTMTRRPFDWKRGEKPLTGPCRLVWVLAIYDASDTRQGVFIVRPGTKIRSNWGKNSAISQAAGRAAFLSYRIALIPISVGPASRRSGRSRDRRDAGPT